MKTKVTVILDPTFVQVPTHHAVRLSKKVWTRIKPVAAHFPIRLQFSKVEDSEPVQDMLPIVTD